MGGIGSGRRGGAALVEDSFIVDLALLRRLNRLQEGARGSIRLEWSCGRSRTFVAHCEYDLRQIDWAFLTLRYQLPGCGVATAPQTQRIDLVYTIPPYGGRRWWMLCPVTGVRVNKLYLPPGAKCFGGRLNWSLGYRLQRVTKDAAPFVRLFALQRKLGCMEGWEVPIRRPKGMWGRTYEPLRLRFQNLDEKCDQQMDRLLALR